MDKEWPGCCGPPEDVLNLTPQLLPHGIESWNNQPGAEAAPRRNRLSPFSGEPGPGDFK